MHIRNARNGLQFMFNYFYAFLEEFQLPLNKLPGYMTFEYKAGSNALLHVYVRTCACSVCL